MNGMLIVHFKEFKFPKSGFLSCNAPIVTSMCHLPPVVLWELLLGEMAQENADTLVTAFSVGNEVLCL